MIPVLGTDQPAATCCEQWFVLAEQLAVVAGEAVRQCLPNCPEFPYYVSHDEPVGPGDYLGVWLANVTPILPQSGRMAFPRATVTIGLIVSQEGYPGPRITGNGIEAVPSPAEHNNGAYFSYGAAEAAYRATMKRSIGGCIGECQNVQVGVLTPERVQMFTARWRWSVTASVDL